MLRKFLCILFLVVLVMPAFSFADSDWASQDLPSERTPVPIEIVPWDELPPENPDQHHYLLLCIDKLSDHHLLSGTERTASVHAAYGCSFPQYAPFLFQRTLISDSGQYDVVLRHPWK